MFKYDFFVSCPGWKDGGYHNTGYAEKKVDIQKRIQKRNDALAGTGCSIKLVSVTEVTAAEFAEDFIG